MTTAIKHCCVILLAVLWTATGMRAQTADTALCKDRVILNNGSVFTAYLREYVPNKRLVLETCAGLMLHFHPNRVKRILQGCGEYIPDIKLKPTYAFPEKGWYHHTRAAILAGNNYGGDAIPGLSLYHASGWQFNRLLGAGIGLGMETYDMESGSEPVTYPLFLEVRSYWMKRRVSPYGALSLGYAWAGKVPNNWNQTVDYDGGLFAKFQVGYRMGNHFTLHGGISVQHKTRHWGNVDSFFGTDRILNKRLGLGLGLLL